MKDQAARSDLHLITDILQFTAGGSGSTVTPWRGCSRRDSLPLRQIFMGCAASEHLQINHINIETNGHLSALNYDQALWRFDKQRPLGTTVIIDFCEKFSWRFFRKHKINVLVTFAHEVVVNSYFCSKVFLFSTRRAQQL